MDNLLKEKICAFLVLLVIAAAYANSLDAPFLFDDHHMITDNVFITQSSYYPLLFKGYVTSAPVPKGMMRPLLMLTFALNYQAGGLRPYGYHMMNIMFHVMNVLLFYLLSKQLTGKCSLSSFSHAKKSAPLMPLFLITLIFAVHPINTEAVTYISSRSDLMSTFFALVTLLLYLRKRYWLTCAGYLLGLFSKETALCIPLLLCAYEYMFRNPDNAPDESDKNNKRYFYMALFIMTVLYFFYRQAVFSPSPVRPLRSFYENILLQSWVTFFYIRLFFMPFPLTILHRVPHLTSFMQPQSFLAIIALVSLIAGGIALGKKRPVIAFGIGWYLICLLPKFYARLHFPAMEHHFYMPGIGIYLVLTAITCRFKKPYKKYLLPAGVGIVFFFIFLSWLRNDEYRDAVSFWQTARKRNPYSATVHNNLGMVYLNDGKKEAAIREFKKAIKTAKKIESTIIAKINLSHIYLSQGKYDEALREASDCLSLKSPPPRGTYGNLGIVYLKQGKEKEAVTAWEKELKFYPQVVNSYLNLGVYYFDRGKLDTAASLFKGALKVNPHHYGGYYGLARVLRKQKKYPEAAALYREAIEHNHHESMLYYELGTLYAQMGDGRALDAFKKAIILNPDYPEAHNDLAVAYASLVPPRWELAKRQASIAKLLGFPVNGDFLALIKEHAEDER